jgi:hypothetical protein
MNRHTYWIDRQINGWTGRWMCGRIDRKMDRYMNRNTDGRDRQINGWTRMERQKGGRSDKQTDR